MKDDGNLRQVLVFGPCDQVASLSDSLNRHRLAKQEDPISAGLIIPSNGNLGGAGNYLAAHASNRLVVLCFKPGEKNTLFEQLEWFNRRKQKVILLLSRKRLDRRVGHNPSAEYRKFGVIAVFDQKEELLNDKLAKFIDRYLDMLATEESTQASAPPADKTASIPPKRKARAMKSLPAPTPTAPAANEGDFVTTSIAQLDNVAALLKAYAEHRATLQSQLENLRRIQAQATRLIGAIEAAFGSTPNIPVAAPAPAQSAAPASTPLVTKVSKKKGPKPKAAKGTRKPKLMVTPKEFTLVGDRSVTIEGAGPQLILETILARASQEPSTLGASEFGQIFGGVSSSFYNYLTSLRSQLAKQLSEPTASRCVVNVSGQGYRWDNSSLSQSTPS